MLDFLKRFGLGILYVIAAPFLLIFLIFWLIYVLVIFIIELIKGFKNYFHGKNFFSEFEEDVEAQKILNANNQISNGPIPLVTPQQQSVNTQQIQQATSEDGDE